MKPSRIRRALAIAECWADPGFVGVTIDEELRKGWICVVGTKPAAH